MRKHYGTVIGVYLTHLGDLENGSHDLINLMLAVRMLNGNIIRSIYARRSLQNEEESAFDKNLDTLMIHYGQSDPVFMGELFTLAVNGKRMDVVHSQSEYHNVIPPPISNW